MNVRSDRLKLAAGNANLVIVVTALVTIMIYIYLTTATRPMPNSPQYSEQKPGRTVIRTPSLTITLLGMGPL